MPSRLAYIGSTGERFELDGDLTYVGTALGIRGRKWDYALGRRNISSQSRKAREASLEASFTDLAEADRWCRVTDRDVAYGTPGRLEGPGGWSQRCYVIGQEPSERYHGYMRADVDVLLLDGVWRRLVSESFGRGTLETDYGKGYEYGYPYDYGPSNSARTYEVDSAAPCPLRLVIYGYAVQPAVTIGGNLYSFDVTVPTGGYLLVDTRPDPTVTLVTADGRSSDAFACARRGAGKGSGQYAFEPLQPGLNTVSWDDSFGFDLGAYLEHSELPWDDGSWTR